MDPDPSGQEAEMKKKGRIRSALYSLKKRMSSIKSKASRAKRRIRRRMPPLPRPIRKLLFRGHKQAKPIKKDRLIEAIFKDFSAGEEERNPRFAFLGIGNDLKGDDGIGWYVIDRLSEKLKGDKNLLFIKTSVPENHVREIRDFAPKTLVIIDAADLKKAPGTIKPIRFEQVRESFMSTHTTPITVFLRLYQEGEPFKKPVTIIGIQRKTNEFGQPISPEVKKSGDRVARIISKLHRKGILDLTLDRELSYISNPLKRVTDPFKKT